EPTRRDITQDVTTLQGFFQETNRMTIALYTNVDAASMTPDATSGELVVDKPDRPATRHYRILTIGVDLADAGEIYVARFLPRASDDEKDDQAFQSGDDPLGWPVTMTAYKDAALGTSERYYFGGPGWAALLADMGFEVGNGGGGGGGGVEGGFTLPSLLPGARLPGGGRRRRSPLPLPRGRPVVPSGRVAGGVPAA